MSILVNLTLQDSVPAAALDHVVKAATAYLETHGALTCERLEPFVQRNSEDVQHLVIWRPEAGVLDAESIDLKDLESIVKKTLRAVRVEQATVRVAASVRERE
jgi:hypothetical protein